MLLQSKTPLCIAWNERFSRGVDLDLEFALFTFVRCSASFKFGPNSRNPPKMRLKKFVKLPGYTYASNRLTFFLIWSVWNGRKRKWRKLAETCFELCIKTYFGVFLAIGNHCAEHYKVGVLRGSSVKIFFSKFHCAMTSILYDQLALRNATMGENLILKVHYYF